MILANDRITPDIRSELVLKAFNDLHKNRSSTVLDAIRHHVKDNGLMRLMTQFDWDEVRNRVTMAFIAINGYLPKQGT